MAIISFDKNVLIDYVPAFAGNRDSDVPCVVRLRFIPYSKIQHYSRMITARTKNTNDGNKTAEVLQEVQKKQFVDSVESISGYFVGENEITLPADFYETADADLVLEIIRAMESSAKLSEGQRKN